MSKNSELIVMEQALEKGFMLHLVGHPQAYFWLSTGWSQLEYAYESESLAAQPDYSKIDIKYIVALIASWYKNVDTGSKEAGEEIDHFWLGLRSHKDYNKLQKEVVVSLMESAYHRLSKIREYYSAVTVLQRLRDLGAWDDNKCHHKLFLLTVDAGRAIISQDYEDCYENGLEKSTEVLSYLSGEMSRFKKVILQNLENERLKASK